MIFCLVIVHESLVCPEQLLMLLNILQILQSVRKLLTSTVFCTKGNYLKRDFLNFFLVIDTGGFTE